MRSYDEGFGFGPRRFVSEYVPVFTSMTELLRYVPEGTGYRKLKGDALLAIWPDDVWMALNRAGRSAYGSRPMTCAARVGPRKLVGSRVPNADEYVLGEPREEPTALLDAIAAFARAVPAIRAAYRALLLVRQPGEQPRIAIGLELDNGADVEGILKGAADAARGSGVSSLVLVPLVAGRREGTVARYLRERTEPFYRRAEQPR